MDGGAFVASNGGGSWSGATHCRHACSTQPYVCVDKEGQSRTRLNVLHADAVPWNSPSDDQLANIILKAIFKVLISTLHTYPDQVCMGPLHMR
jgi:hypothetical protein